MLFRWLFTGWKVYCNVGTPDGQQNAEFVQHQLRPLWQPFTQYRSTVAFCPRAMILLALLHDTIS